MEPADHRCGLMAAANRTPDASHAGVMVSPVPPERLGYEIDRRYGRAWICRSDQ
jgi:hypothetical protein